MVSKEFLDLKNIRTQYLGPHKGGRNTHGILLKKGLYKLSGPFPPKVRIRLYSTENRHTLSADGFHCLKFLYLHWAKAYTVAFIFPSGTTEKPKFSSNK